MGIAGISRGGEDLSIGVHHAHGVSAPALDCLSGGRQGGFKARVAHGEVLGTMVKVAERRATGGHAPPTAAAFLENSYPHACLGECAGAGDPRDTGADDGDVRLSFDCRCFGTGHSVS